MHVIGRGVGANVDPGARKSLDVRAGVEGLVVVSDDSDRNASATGIENLARDAVVGDGEHADVKRTPGNLDQRSNGAKTGGPGTEKHSGRGRRGGWRREGFISFFQPVDSGVRLRAGDVGLGQLEQSAAHQVDLMRVEVGVFEQLRDRLFLAAGKLAVGQRLLVMLDQFIDGFPTHVYSLFLVPPRYRWAFLCWNLAQRAEP